MEWEQIAEDPLIAGIVVTVAVVVVLAVIIGMSLRRGRRDRYERRYGAEYQRTVRERGSRRAAERDLRLRREQRDEMHLRSLTADEREAFRGRFEQIQASFVDAPEASVRSADHLLDEVAAERGYEEADGWSRVAMVGVDHPEDAAVHQRAMARLDSDQRLDTEELRQAVLAARRLLELLMAEGQHDEPPTPEPPRSLLGLDEDEDEAEGDTELIPDDVAAGDESRPPRRRRRGSQLGLDEGRGNRRDPEDREEPGEPTIDLTEDDRSRESR